MSLVHPLSLDQTSFDTILEISRGEGRKGSMVKTNFFHIIYYSSKRGIPM
jgi:hypothetical protein